MLPGPHRLRSRQDFQAIYQQGQSWHGQYFVAWVLKHPDIFQGLDSNMQLAPSRLGIVVGKKVSNLAVRRNQVKRQIRRACWELLAQIKPGWDAILIARHSAADLQAEQFLPELKQLMAQTGILDGY